MLDTFTIIITVTQKETQFRFSTAENYVIMGSFFYSMHMFIVFNTFVYF